jgi:alkanesulfonate monooxygenase SsuD/methylene tetrahydromethanopterin reductase-like flavin-dependent oxidoreductase (luciferase family)
MFQMQIPADLLHLGTDVPDRVAGRWGVPTEVLRDCPLALVGSVDEVAERLRRWRVESGVSYLVVPADAMAAASPLVERLAGR